VCVCVCVCVCPITLFLPGEVRVQLLNQTLLDLGFYDDGPYEVADEKQLNAQLIPVPYHSYLGRTVPALCCFSHSAASLLSCLTGVH
jgi:hypothetical protein